jgi:ABC-type Mn2+/Zn2+ transport system ATPase subunit
MSAATGEAAAPALCAAGLTVRYGELTALRGVGFSLERGEILGLVGPNGSGKSTLLKAICGLVPPAAGEVRVFGKRPRALPRGTIAYVPQAELVDWNFPASVWDVVAMGRFPRIPWWRPFGAADRRIVRDALAALRILDLADRHISELSGGQQQRTFVARALAQRPEVLLLDEPTTGVDAATQEALRHAVRELARDGLPIVVSTHDLDSAADWFDRMILLDRSVLATGTAAEVLSSPVYAQVFADPASRRHGHAGKGHA